MSRMYENFNGAQNMIGQIKQFRETFKGDPSEQLNALMKSGSIPQGMLNQAQQMAQPIYQLMKSLK